MGRAFGDVAESCRGVVLRPVTMTPGIIFAVIRNCAVAILRL
jgi:hypothetical protein